MEIHLLLFSQFACGEKKKKETEKKTERGRDRVREERGRERERGGAEREKEKESSYTIVPVFALRTPRLRVPLRSALEKESMEVVFGCCCCCFKSSFTLCFRSLCQVLSEYVFFWLLFFFLGGVLAQHLYWGRNFVRVHLCFVLFLVNHDVLHQIKHCYVIKHK